MFPPQGPFLSGYLVLHHCLAGRGGKLLAKKQPPYAHPNLLQKNQEGRALLPPRHIAHRRVVGYHVRSGISSPHLRPGGWPSGVGFPYPAHGECLRPRGCRMRGVMGLSRKFAAWSIVSGGPEGRLQGRSNRPPSPGILVRRERSGEVPPFQGSAPPSPEAGHVPFPHRHDPPTWLPQR